MSSLTVTKYHDDGEKELGPTVATLSLGSQAVMTLRPKAKCRVGAESKNAKGTKVDVLKMVLRHGDLVVMHGTGIQKLYEASGPFKYCLKFTNSQTACCDSPGGFAVCFNLSLRPSRAHGECRREAASRDQRHASGRP